MTPTAIVFIVILSILLIALLIRTVIRFKLGRKNLFTQRYLLEEDQSINILYHQPFLPLNSFIASYTDESLIEIIKTVNYRGKIAVQVKIYDITSNQLIYQTNLYNVKNIEITNENDVTTPKN